MQQTHPQDSIPYPVHIYSAGNPFPHQALAYYTIPPPPNGFYPLPPGVEQQLYVYTQTPPFFNPANQQIGEGSRLVVVHHAESIVPTWIVEGSRALAVHNPESISKSIVPAAQISFGYNSALTVVPSTPQQELSIPAASSTVNKNNNVQPEYCSICQLSCNSKIAYDQHVIGKKHLKKLALSGLPPVKEQVEKVLELSNSQIARKKRKASAVEDMESKRKKVVQAGASADHVIVCAPCNVICNNRIVYDAHIKGAKHLLVMHRQ